MGTYRVKLVLGLSDDTQNHLGPFSASFQIHRGYMGISRPIDG